MPDPALIDPKPLILWFRRDLRLADHPALEAAIATGRPVIPLYILEEAEGVRRPGAASLWWLDKSLRALAADLEARGSRLILRRGDAARIVEALARETGAAALYWSRLYDGEAVARDTAIKTALKDQGVDAQSFNASLLIEPWALKTGAGEPFKVFTPFWKALRSAVGDFTLHLAPDRLTPPAQWPASDDLAGWGLHPAKPDWSKGFDLWRPGEAGAMDRLHAFLRVPVADYPAMRDRPAVEGGSRLSPHLHWGEIGPRQVWRAAEGVAHRHPEYAPAVDKFLSELAWREFDHQLLFHNPGLRSANYKPAFDRFPWRTDAAGFRAWTRGETGYPLVDAGMRELWTTGFMHNRVRMITASFLIKHLMVDWRLGEQWFWDTLLDACEANNPANWQWVAGSGADAAPFFRIFSPIGQGERFDPDGAYVRRWVPELAKLDAKFIHAPWTAPDEALKDAGVTLRKTYPNPIVDHTVARERALEAFRSIKA
jgi:deoxyribodipyrimidine photo-lyase